MRSELRGHHVGGDAPVQHQLDVGTGQQVRHFKVQLLKRHGQLHTAQVPTPVPHRVHMPERGQHPPALKTMHRHIAGVGQPHRRADAKQRIAGHIGAEHAQPRAAIGPVKLHLAQAIGLQPLVGLRHQPVQAAPPQRQLSVGHVDSRGPQIEHRRGEHLHPQMRGQVGLVGGGCRAVGHAQSGLLALGHQMGLAPIGRLHIPEHTHRRPSHQGTPQGQPQPGQPGRTDHGCRSPCKTRTAA